LAVAVDLDEFEVGEDVPVEVERGGSGAALEGQEGSQSLGHGTMLSAPTPFRLGTVDAVRLFVIGVACAEDDRRRTRR
jgi:hypothetical protein